MTEEIKNGLVSGGDEQVGGNGDEQKTSEGKTAIDSNVDELAKMKVELAKRDATISKQAEEKRKQDEIAEKARISSLSTEEQLKEALAKIKAREEEQSLLDASISKGLNPKQASELAKKVKDGDFDGMADLMSTMLSEVKKATSEQVERDVKSNIVTSSAPVLAKENQKSSRPEFNKPWNKFK